MTLSHLKVLVLIRVPLRKGHNGSSDKMVCNSAKGAYYNNTIFFLILHNPLQAEDALYGTYRCSSKLKYFHNSVNDNY